MDTQPLISIIFPVYGVEHAVEASIRSVLEQTYGEMEVVVVDDCTPDASMEIVRRVASEPRYAHRRIQMLRHEKNGGLSAARNTGVRHASGQYICFVDSDDTIPPEAMRTHVDALVQTGADFTDGNMRVEGHADIFAHYTQWRHVEGGDNVLRSYFTNMHVSACNKLIRRSLLTDHDIYFVEGMLYEDVAWLLKLCNRAAAYVQIPADTYTYIIRDGSITRSDDPQRCRRRADSYLRMLAETAPLALQTHLPEGQQWLAKLKVRVKYNICTMPLPIAEKRAFFRRCREQVPGRSAGLFGILDSLSPAFFTLVVRYPLELIRKIKRK